MKRLATIAMIMMMALPLLAAPTAAQPGDNGGPGNSGAAHACQGDGYLAYTRADGSGFANSDECASYGAQGGTLVDAPVRTVSVSFEQSPTYEVACVVTVSVSGFADGTYTVEGSAIDWIDALIVEGGSGSVSRDDGYKKGSFLDASVDGVHAGATTIAC